jgi:hypothetical protein
VASDLSSATVFAMALVYRFLPLQAEDLDGLRPRPLAILAILPFKNPQTSKLKVRFSNPNVSDHIKALIFVH